MHRKNAGLQPRHWGMDIDGTSYDASLDVVNAMLLPCISSPHDTAAWATDPTLTSKPAPGSSLKLVEVPIIEMQKLIESGDVRAAAIANTGSCQAVVPVPVVVVLAPVVVLLWCLYPFQLYYVRVHCGLTSTYLSIWWCIAPGVIHKYTNVNDSSVFSYVEQNAVEDDIENEIMDNASSVTTVSLAFSDESSQLYPDIPKYFT